MCDNEALISSAVGFNCALPCFSLLLPNKYSSVEVINKVDDVPITTAKTIGTAKLSTASPPKIAIGNNANSVVTEVNTVRLSVLFTASLIVSANGLFGLNAIIHGCDQAPPPYRL